MTTNYLDVDHLSVAIDGESIVRDVSFKLKQGEVGSLLGPSGCGKTTLLRTIAGFEKPSNGSVSLRERVISSSSVLVSPEKRRIGMVFQDLALFPHLNISENVGFALRDLPNKQRTNRINELLSLVSLESHAKKYPHELSGGQQQRVALVRAMATRPDILLLDEPFSGQDIERREQLADEVGKLLREDGITALLVTHDQYEAFAFADKIGVLNEGEILQWDSAYNLYHEPKTKFVADFIGQGVFVKGRVVDSKCIQTPLGRVCGHVMQEYPAGTAVELLVRPDDVLHDDLSDNKAEIEDRSFRGADHLYTLKMTDELRLLCLAPSHHNHKIGERIGINLALDHLVVFPV